MVKKSVLTIAGDHIIGDRTLLGSNCYVKIPCGDEVVTNFKTEAYQFEIDPFSDDVFELPLKLSQMFTVTPNMNC